MLGQGNDLLLPQKKSAIFRSGRKNRLGRYGENLAVKHLLKRGYYIWKRNWAVRSGEIDIIAIQEHTLVFVEVKTRLKDVAPTFDPFDAVDNNKIKHIQKVSESFLEKYHAKLRYRRINQIRFDIIGVIVSSKLNDFWLRKESLIHYENAFQVEYK